VGLLSDESDVLMVAAGGSTLDRLVAIVFLEPMIQHSYCNRVSSSESES
jgi:hypothetical protein